MVSDLNKKKRTAGRGSAVVNTPGVKPPATVPEDRVEILRHLPQKKGATIVPPPGSGSASSPETAGGAYNAVGSYGAAGGDEAKESVSAVSPEVPAREEAASFRAPEADRAAQLRYDSALAALERKQGEAPRYDSRYDEQIRQLYEQITGRRPFRYDSATDPLYQQYAQRYTEQGAQAMRDTMGRAAALTGGYGSSYAQSVGQQQFDAYLRRLADVLPQTYGMALDAYRAEGDELQRRYDLTAELEKSDYERYLDSLGQYNREVAQARDDVDDAREALRYGDETAYRRAADDYNRRVAADKLAYSRRQDAYERLVRLLAAGYTPSAEEYAQAGMSPAQGAALLAPAESGPTVIVRTQKTDAKSRSTKKTASKSGRRTQGSFYKQG